ncbi:GTPase ObgE [candidate division KSB1 bacterium]|nr:GTPase ObgE [candidate division KSB1 bacterium]
MFVDEAKIHIIAGSGGAGCVAFRREKYVPKGGPSGGDGGNGGHVIAVADRNLHTLLDFKYKTLYKAGNGRHGQGDNKTGKSGASCSIRLPVGTVIKNAENEKILADLVKEGQQLIIAKGGRGGRGNARFVTATNRTPREWETGQVGEEKYLLLELKLFADVGLVGLPNAGKSTLLSKISAARPKIANYPFTTLSPNLGIVRVEEGKSFVVADIPGLIEGAHQGKGLGIQFLRHIERTRVLVILLDLTSNLERDYKVLMKELSSYSRALLKKKRIIVYNKSDLIESKDISLLSNEKSSRGRLVISAIRGDQLEQLKRDLWELIQESDSISDDTRNRE